MIPLQTASRHPVSRIAFSSDGSAVAVAQPHYGVTILDRATGGTLAACAMPRRTDFTGLTFCGGGKYLAAAHAKGLEVFEANSGAQVFRNFRYPQRFQLAVCGDTLLAAPLRNYTALYPKLTITDAVAEPESKRALLHRGDLAFEACSPDGSRLLGRSRNRFALLRADTAWDIAEVEYPDDEPAPQRVTQFCPTGRRFAICDGRALDVYDAGESSDEGEEEPVADASLARSANGKAVAVAPLPHAVLAPTFTLKPADAAEAGKWYPPFALLADGRGLLVKRPRNRIQWWDAPTGTVVNEWSWRFEWVTCVAVAADGLTAVAGGRFGRVLLWDLE
jgi:hypothetical protein